MRKYSHWGPFLLFVLYKQISVAEAHFYRKAFGFYPIKPGEKFPLQTENPAKAELVMENLTAG